MCDAIDLKLAGNLRRWRESGQPRQWVESRGGRWSHDDWLALLENLRWSEFWPVEPDAVGALLEECRAWSPNLRQWKESGAPQQWVESRRGQWSHDDWLGLLENLRQSAFWPLDPNDVGQVLEECKRVYLNFVRWQASGHPRRWIEARQGSWDHDDWLSLLDALRQSDFWPLAPAAIARVLEEGRREWWNLRRWTDSGLARRWVEAHRGQWNHDDWLDLLASLRTSVYWPVAPDLLGQVLEEAKAQWWNLQHWRDSGQPGRWIEAHADGWDGADLQRLLDEVWQSEFWPLDRRAVRGLLEELDRERENLSRWRESGAPERWVKTHRGAWGHADWLGLLDELRSSEYWPLPVGEVGEALEEAKRQVVPAVLKMPVSEWFKPRRKAA